MILYQSSAPATEPVTTAEIKTHCRVSGSEDDTYLDSLVATARQHVESITNRALITQTWVLSLDRFPVEIELPKPPLVSIESIAYTSTSGSSSTVATSVYDVDTASLPARVFLKYGKSWPTDVRDISKAITITYVAGYGDADAVPDALKESIKLLAADMFEQREITVTGTIVATTKTFNNLVSQYRYRHTM